MWIPLSGKNIVGERLFGSSIRWGILSTLYESIEPLTANYIAAKLRADTKTTYRMVNELIAAGFVKPIEGKGRRLLVLAENPRGQAVRILVESIKRPPVLTASDFRNLVRRRSEGEIDALAAIARKEFKRTFAEIPTGYKMRTGA